MQWKKSDGYVQDGDVYPDVYWLYDGKHRTRFNVLDALDGTGMFLAFKGYGGPPLCRLPLEDAKARCEELYLAFFQRRIQKKGNSIESFRQRIKGETCIERYPADVPVEALGNVRVLPCRKHLIEKTPWIPNIIVDSISTLLGALFSGETGYTGIQYVVVGSGDADWDVNGTPDPGESQTVMDSEIARVAASIVYLDAANAETASVTGRLAITGTFGPNDGNGDWREWGLAGGNATATQDTGLLIDYQTHDIVSKTTNDTILRRVRLSF